MIKQDFPPFKMSNSINSLECLFPSAKVFGAVKMKGKCEQYMYIYVYIYITRNGEKEQYLVSHQRKET